tara:strand:+ start:185 stop:1471 length:1287 start_codon:yes stop_codon:yes gene_type:complete
MANCVENPGQIRALAASIKSGEVTATALVQRYLDRIDVVQPVAEPWREIDGERALTIAAQRDEQVKKGNILGPLHGVPVAVKDIIDVAGLPTRCNCKAYQDRAPATADAEIVLALKAAGAIILGKAHTTEFALFDPSPARNPHNTEHTPGGSSSGSAAAVASGTAPLALGTQTMASLNRPAAYCGIAAFKPSTRSVCGYGVNPLAPSYDTVGFYGWSVDDAVYAYESLSPYGSDAVDADAIGRILFLEDDLIADADAEMASAVAEQLVQIGELGYKVERVSSPFPFSKIGTLHWNTMIFEAGRVLVNLAEYPDELIGERLRGAIAEGQAIPEEQYIAERAQLNEFRKTFFTSFALNDVFLWPAAPGPAPKGIQSTGEPKYIAPWTALGGPMVTVPIGKTSAGLPLGSILCGAPGTDLATGAIARAVSA